MTALAPQGGRTDLGLVILDHVATGVVVLDESGRVLHLNQPAARLLDRRATECAGLAAEELLGPAAAAQILALTAVTPAECRLSLQLTRPDGTSLRTGATVILPPTGALADVGLLVVFRDGEAQPFADESARHGDGQAALGRIVAGLSHELRNPLAAIQGLSQVLMSECPPEDSRFEPARRIGELVARMERLIAACVEAGSEAPPHRTTTAADVLARRAVQDAASSFAGGETRPHLLVAPGDLAVHVDVLQVTQCLRALVDNACEAAGDPRQVEVRVARGAGARQSQGRVQIEVSDPGPGIPAPLLVRIFEPFYTTKPDHLGLGLAVAQSLALRNGATLDARSRPGRTVFTLSLPAVTRS